MPRRRHIRVALQIAVVTVTVVFILSFFPGTPSSVYSSNDVDLSAIKPHHGPLALKSSNSIAPEATATNRAHSSTHGKSQPVQPHDRPSKDKSHDAKTETGSRVNGNTDTEKSNSGKTDTGKDNVGKTGSGKTDSTEIDSEKVDNGNTHTGKTDTGKSGYGKAGTGKSDMGEVNIENTGDGKADSEKPETEKTSNGKSDTEKTDVESDSGKKPEDDSEETKEQSSHNSEEDRPKPEEPESDSGSKFEDLGSDKPKPKTYKKPSRYGQGKKVAPPLTSHSFAKVILNPEESGPSRLGCPPVSTARYRHLLARKPAAKNWKGELKRKYYFALDLFECQAVLPTLMGAIVETIKYLGPENCALSIVEGRSRDWTYDILDEVGEAMTEMGVKFNLTTNPIDPLSEDVDRIISLAELRNQALQPLYDHPEDYTSDSIVLFINDITPCVDDILELVHQLDVQKADLTCSMDWQSRGTVLYDFWVSRAINGDSFFEIPQNGGWEFSQNMFWNEPNSKERIEALQPVQVYACWNGMVVFRSKPLLKDGIRFRGQRENECYMGEPTYLAKDFWAAGHGRIAIVPSVNVAYTLTEAIATKKYRGYVDEVVEFARGTEVQEFIDWQKEPPAMVKCAKTWDKPSWVPPL